MGLTRLSELARKAGRWLGRNAEGVTEPATGVVAADRFDEMAWRDTFDAARGLRELADDLGQHHNYATDLLRDVFTAAYRVNPEVRAAEAVDPSRAVNRQILAQMLESPEFAELRRETVGDPYAAAMAVISQGQALAGMLTRAEDAQRAADAAAAAAKEAAEAAAAVAAAITRAAGRAGDGDDGDVVPDGEVAAVNAAIAAAGAADAAAEQAAAEARAALAAVAPALRAAGRELAGKATAGAREEAALMSAWGVGPGQLERMPFDERAALARRLRSGRLGEFADLVGRFRAMAAGERARRVEGAPGELVGITLGGDVSRAIPSEVAMLGVPALRPVFAAKLAEGRLMMYETRGEENAGKGAIIAVVDCSGSMRVPRAGRDGRRATREAWAKALALALLDQARSARPRRDFVAVLFSGVARQRVFRFPADREPAIGDVVEMAETFFGGGTDWERPLALAAEVLDAEFNADGRQHGDIVLVTDGECDVSETWVREWREAKARCDFRLFGVGIGDEVDVGPGSTLAALCDNVRTIDDITTPDGARDMFRVI